VLLFGPLPEVLLIILYLEFYLSWFKIWDTRKRGKIKDHLLWVRLFEGGGL